MSARAHACVVLLLASTSTVGCLFGGGGDKKRAPRAAQPIDRSVSGSEYAAAEGGVRERSPAAGSDAAPDGALAPAARRDRQMVDEAVSRALASKPSEVEWPGSEAFRLADEPTSPRPEPIQASPEAYADRSDEIPRAAVAVTPRATPLPQHRAGEAPGRFPGDRANLAVRGSVSVVPGVANEQLELPPAGGHPSPGRADLSVPSPLDSGDLARTLAGRLRDNPGDLAAHLDYQLLRFLQDDPVPDLDAIAGLQGEDRELLTALVDALSNFRNGVRADGNMLLSQKIRPLLELAARLRSQAELSIPTIALCSKVQKFGIYDPMPGRFAAGKLNYTIAYCELDNVSARKNDKGEWESKLTQQAVLYTEQGQPVWSNERHAVVDRSRNRREDFFVRQMVELPPSLTIGRYLLKVTVEDEQIRRVAEATVPIEVVAALPPHERQPQQQPAVKSPDRPRSGSSPAAAPDPIAEPVAGQEPQQGLETPSHVPDIPAAGVPSTPGAITGARDAGDAR
jgi:hypothetical protein